jgi:ApbE superfamily uncharacterized protein (UPF0280 family)
MEPRTYRHWIESQELTTFQITVEETDVYIRASSNLERKARRLVIKYRSMLESYIKSHPIFLTSLEPLPIPEDAPQIVTQMAQAARNAGVGPMAAVAGAIAEFVGRELLEFSPEIIVENGGDIYLKSQKRRTIGIYAGKSSLTGKIGVEINAQDTPMGICTSSGTVGHSLSFGKADAVVVLARSAILADAAATAIGNAVAQAEDIEYGIELAKSIKELNGLIIIKDDNLGIWGEIKLCETSI